MSASYVPYAPEQDLLLPPTLQEWLPEGHLAYFIGDTVESLDLSAFHARYAHGGPRNQPFHPAMMVKVLLYGYATGTFSSRKLARKLHEDIAFRVLAAGNFPAHRTISDFRANHLAELSGLFVQVVQLARECGLASLGTIAIDGTKLKANASRHKAMSYRRMRESETKLRAQIDALMTRASSADAAEADEPDLDIPAEIKRREQRLATIAAAKARLEARQRKADEAKGRRDDDDRRPRGPDGKPRGGRYARDFGVPKDEAQENFTDPDSRIMKHGNGAFEQSYNAHTAVDADNGIIVAAELSQNASDADRLPAMLDAVAANAGGAVPGQTLADAGFRSEAVFEQLAAVDTDLIVSLGREGRDVGKIDAASKPRTAAMAEHLQDEAAKAAYRRRKHIVEPPNGWIKSVLGFHQFSLRGAEKVAHEFRLVSMATNLRRMAYL